MSDSVEIVDCICCWYDLLGYGKPFVDAKWDLNDKNCQMNFERIQNVRMQFTSTWAVQEFGTKLTFNDGFASTIDVDIASRSAAEKMLFFLDGIINDFDSINHYDKKMKFPGVRGIITFGQRFSYDSCNSSYDISAKRTTTYYPIEFQMNTAFSKAFIMEESGSRAGFAGSNLFVDVEVYHILKQAAERNGYQLPEVIDNGDSLLIKVYGKDGWFADAQFGKERIEYEPNKQYNNRGIKTILYKYRPDSLYSTVDEIASKSAHQDAYRYSLMEEEEEIFENTHHSS